MFPGNTIFFFAIYVKRFELASARKSAIEELHIIIIIIIIININTTART